MFGTLGGGGFGSNMNSTFGAAPANNSFGGGGFGATSTPAFGSGSTNLSGFGGGSAVGASTATPASGIAQGSRLAQYAETIDPTGKCHLISISAMPAFKHKSFEELRYEDYMMQKGIPIQETAPPPSTSTSLFGATPAASSSFGASTPTSSFGGGGGFGTSTTGFGASNVTSTPASFGGNSGGLFGSSTPATTGFGSAATTQFGANSTPASTTSNTMFGGSTGFGTAGSGTNLFGSSTTNTTPSTATGFNGFGAATNTSTNSFGAAAPAAATGFSGFGTTATPGFGASAAAPSTSLFGGAAAAPATSNTFSSFGNAPTTSGGLFGATPTLGGFGAASTTPALGTSLFGAQPATNTTGFPATTQASTSLFGGVAAPNTAGSTGASLFGGAATSTPSFSLNNTATKTPATGFGAAASGNSLFGAASSAPASTSLFGSTLGAPSTAGTLFGASTPAPANKSLFGGGGTATITGSGATSTPNMTSSFGGTSTTPGTTSLFGNTAGASTSLFGATPTPSSFPTTTPSLGGFGSLSATTTPAASTSLFGNALQTPAKLAPGNQVSALPQTPATIDSNPFGLTALASSSSTTSLSFSNTTSHQCATPTFTGSSALTTTPSTTTTTAAFTPAQSSRSVARMYGRRSRVTPKPSPFDDDLFSVAALTSASKVSIPRVFKPKMPPIIDLDAPNTTKKNFNEYLADDKNERSELQLNKAVSAQNASSDASARIEPSSADEAFGSLLPIFDALLEQGYDITPNVDTLKTLSRQALTHVNFRVARDGHGYAQWKSLDLTAWAGIDLSKLITINQTIKLKGDAKRGVVTCGLKAATESSAYKERVAQFFQQRGYTFHGIRSGMCSFSCDFDAANVAVPDARAA